MALLQAEMKGKSRLKGEERRKGPEQPLPRGKKGGKEAADMRLVWSALKRKKKHCR